jgi:hypothetical protein
MKELFFTENSISELANYLIQIDKELGDDIDDDFLTEMIAANMDRYLVIDDFKSFSAKWFFFIKFALNKQDFKLAHKCRQVIDIEKKNAMALIKSLGEEEEDDADVLDYIIGECSQIMLTPIPE